jgi:hypothetical protein
MGEGEYTVDQIPKRKEHHLEYCYEEEIGRRGEAQYTRRELAVVARRLAGGSVALGTGLARLVFLDVESL